MGNWSGIPVCALKLWMCAMAFALGSVPSPAFAGTEAGPGAPHKWKVLIGGTIADSKLDEANADIHRIEQELRTIAPSVATFDDWDDMTKATVGLGVQRSLTVGPLKFWPQLYVAYGNGTLRNGQDGVPTVFGAPMDYSFSQEYTLWMFQFGVLWEALRVRPLALLLGGFVDYNRFRSETKVRTQIPAIGEQRTVDGDFRDSDIGYAASVNLLLSLPYSFELMGIFRYGWATFNGHSDINDRQSGPPGDQVSSYAQDTEVDVSGPAWGLYLVWSF